VVSGKHDSGETSTSPKSGHGGKHSADPPTTARTDAGKLLGPRDAPKGGGK
jgi:hypothetical protein